MTLSINSNTVIIKDLFKKTCSFRQLFWKFSGYFSRDPPLHLQASKRQNGYLGEQRGRLPQAQPVRRGR
jgi:hypothetical protein